MGPWKQFLEALRRNSFLLPGRGIADKLLCEGHLATGERLGLEDASDKPEGEKTQGASLQEDFRTTAPPSATPPPL